MKAPSFFKGLLTCYLIKVAILPGTPALDCVAIAALSLLVVAEEVVPRLFQQRENAQLQAVNKQLADMNTSLAEMRDNLGKVSLGLVSRR